MQEFTFDIEEHIKFIIDNFNFNRVKSVMHDFKWLWLFDDELREPTINELKYEAYTLLSNLYYSDKISIETGGLRAIKKDDYLMLEFVLTETSSQYVNYNDKYLTIKNMKKRKHKLEKIYNNGKYN